MSSIAKFLLFEFLISNNEDFAMIILKILVAKKCYSVCISFVT